MRRRWPCACFLILGVGLSPGLQAEQSDDSALMQLHAEHALNAVFGLPGVASRPVQTREWQLSLEHGNQFFGSVHGSPCEAESDCPDGNGADHESLFLDGETSQLTIRHRQSLGSCWQGELMVPFYQHTGGEFDRAIEDWHEFFGMPDAGRQYFATDQLLYHYEDGSGEKVRVDAPQSGIGDIVLSVQHVLDCQATADTTGEEIIVRAGLKLPTGSLSELRGSGRSDVFLDVQSPVWRLTERWHGGASLGLMFPGRNARLPDQQAVVAFGALGAQFRLNHRYRAMMQFDWHTAFYRSELSELGGPTVVFSAGLRYLLRERQTLELSISEDILVESAPDIVARLAWVYRPALPGSY